MTRDELQLELSTVELEELCGGKILPSQVLVVVGDQMWQRCADKVSWRLLEDHPPRY